MYRTFFSELPGHEQCATMLVANVFCIVSPFQVEMTETNPHNTKTNRAPHIDHYFAEYFNVIHKFVCIVVQ